MGLFGIFHNFKSKYNDLDHFELLNGLKANCFMFFSVLTKQFAINNFDKRLVDKIKKVRNLIEKISMIIIS